jgi:hypothetical protein
MTRRGSVLADMSPSSRQAVVADIEAAARALRGDDALERIRAATARLAARDVDPADPRATLALLESHVDIDIEVPTGSRLRGVGLLKRALKRLVGWYVRYVGQQVTLLGQAVVRFGNALVEHTESLDRAVAHNQRELDGLAARVDRLERQAGLAPDTSAPQ